MSLYLMVRPSVRWSDVATVLSRVETVPLDSRRNLCVSSAQTSSLGWKENDSRAYYLRLFLTKTTTWIHSSRASEKRERPHLSTSTLFLKNLSHLFYWAAPPPFRYLDLCLGYCISLRLRILRVFFFPYISISPSLFPSSVIKFKKFTRQRLTQDTLIFCLFFFPSFISSIEEIETSLPGTIKCKSFSPTIIIS